jgi:hypothetical protein
VDLRNEETIMFATRGFFMGVLFPVALTTIWTAGAAPGKPAPAAAIASSPADSLATLRAAIVELEQRVQALEASMATGAGEEAMRVASTDLDGLGGASWTPTGPPPSGGVEIESNAGDPLLRFSGFGDLQYEARESEPGMDGEKYSIGQAELDLESSFSDAVQLAGAIAFNPDESQFELGVFAIDFHLWGRDEGHMRESSWLNSSGIAAGQFDVPFGIDWQVNTSIDRRTVSRPLVVEETHGAWNDLGVNAYFSTGHLNGAFFVLNGFDDEEPCNGLCSAPVDIRSRRAYGGRVGLAPAEWLEVGGSYAYLPSEADEGTSGVTPRNMSLAGADIRVAGGPLSLRGEYIDHHLAMDVQQETDQGSTLTAYARDDSGFYTTAMYDFGKYFLIAQYDRFSPGGAGEADLDRVTGGAGWVVREQCELRLEYQSWSGDEPDAAYMQLAVGF